MEIPENRRVVVLGITGFLGGAVSRALSAAGIQAVGTSLSNGTDIRNALQLRRFFSETRPQIVFNCAAYVGGIQFGFKHPAELYFNNLQMSLNTYEACVEFQISRLVNPISNCIYPSRATLFREDEVWEGPLDSSVLVYGMARKAHYVGSIAYKQQHALDSMNVVLPNVFGPGDHFDPLRSHALGALISKIVQAKRKKEPQVVIWGSGKPVREWLYIDDAAAAMVAAADADSYDGLINVGTGAGVTIFETATMISAMVSYEGDLVCDLSKPDGAPHKTLDGTRARERLGWKPGTSFEDGLRRTVSWFLSRSEE